MLTLSNADEAGCVCACVSGGHGEGGGGAGGTRRDGVVAALVKRQCRRGGGSDRISVSLT